MEEENISVKMQRNLYDWLIIIIRNAIILLQETEKYGDLTVEEMCLELGVDQEDFDAVKKEMESANGC